MRRCAVQPMVVYPLFTMRHVYIAKGDRIMPLKIELKPFERLIIGGASIRNGDRRSSFIIETNTKFLRETDIITESDADTACKRLYVTLEFVYLSDEPGEAENAF